MARPPFLLLALLTIAAPLAACGGGNDPLESTPEFDAAYAPIDERFQDVGAQILEAVGTPGEPISAGSAERLGELGEETGGIADDLAALEPPEDLVDATETMQEGLEETADGLVDLAAAAQSGDSSAADAALEQIGAVGPELSGARDVLAEVTGPSGGQEE